MAKTRKFIAYRRLKRPYTRISKFRKKSYIRTRPASKVVRYEMGNSNKKFNYTLSLVAKEMIQIRHNAIESGRQSANKVLERQIGKSNFHFKMRIYPHHIMRENPLAAGAGADRMSTGMKMAFGKPIGAAAQLRKPGKTVLDIHVNKEHITLARTAMKRFMYKLPGTYSINVVENKEIDVKAA